MTLSHIESIWWDFDDTLYPESKEWKKAALEHLVVAFANKFYDGVLNEQIRSQYHGVIVGGFGSNNSAWSYLQKLPEGTDLSEISNHTEISVLVSTYHRRTPTDPEFVEKIIDQEDRAKYLQPDQQIIEMFEEFRRNFPQLPHNIFSNSTEWSVERLMEHLEIQKEWFVNLLFCDGETILKKPDPSGYRRITEIEQFKPNEILYVGDSNTKDIAPANQVGLTTVKVWSNEPSQATVTVNHPKELLQYF
tara:strand:- start:1939 stop:2682 length:744 start_codon:yes stop_codon:yes gene_type:complete